MYDKELRNLGLSDKETRVYIASMELGPNTVQNIAQKAGVNRPTTYVQIESLKKKGLMSEFDKGKKTFFVAESPERLGSLLNSIEKELTFKKAELSRILPGLSELFAGAGERPKVRFFEGVEAVVALREEYLAVKSKRIESMVNLDKLLELLPNIEDEYTSLRVNKGIQSQMLYTRSTGPLTGINDPAKLREARFIKEGKFPFLADITIFDDKVEIQTYKAQPIGVIIESPEIADTMRALFHMIWDMTPATTSASAQVTAPSQDQAQS